MKNVEKI